MGGGVRLSTGTRAKNRKKLFDRDRGVCSWCGSTKVPTVDHVVSLDHGGTNKIDNLRTLCKDCHVWRNRSIQIRMLFDRPLKDWYDVQDYLVYKYPMI